MVGIYLTEAGIIFHSVMIGLTLGVASGPPFKTLLMALSLHQVGTGHERRGLGCCAAALFGVRTAAVGTCPSRASSAGPPSSSSAPPAQLFEGFAIGSAAVDSGLGAARSAALGLAFSVTTPIGIVAGGCELRAGRRAGCARGVRFAGLQGAVPRCLRPRSPLLPCLHLPSLGAGIVLRESVSRSAALALLASGLFDALSAGVLIYVCLVELLTPMFTDSTWLRSQRWTVQAAAFAALYSGAAVMALLGKWA